MQALKAQKEKNPPQDTLQEAQTTSGADHPDDATPYEWFGGNDKYALHGAIDDATGKVVWPFMTQNECLYGYLETMRQCCVGFGIPQTVYSDNHTIFRSLKTGKLTVDELIADKLSLIHI